MFRKTRVLVVDDSVVARRLLARTLGCDPDVEVVATASNGRIALARIAESHPDVVTLDIEMPEMDGLETLITLRKLHPSLTVIMFSVFTQPTSFSMLNILASHAVDYVTKPLPGAGIDAAERVIRENLLPRIKKFRNSSNAGSAAASHASLPSESGAAIPRNTAGEGVGLVVIGVSTGGPDALAKLLPSLPEDFPVSILIVQHMPPIFTQQLAQRLAAVSRIDVAEGVSGQKLLPGHAWLAPGDLHMTVEAARGGPQICLDSGPRINSCRPSVDLLFQSAAKIFGSQVLAVVMTGMGQDGFLGCVEISRAGGEILVQDEASSAVWGMPKAIVDAGLASRVLPLSELGEHILRRVNADRRSGTFPTLRGAAAPRGSHGH